MKLLVNELPQKNHSKPQNNFSLVNGFSGASLFHLELFLKNHDKADLKKSLAFYRMATIHHKSSGIFLPLLYGGSAGLIWLENLILKLLKNDLSQTEKDFVKSNYKTNKEHLTRTLPNYLKPEGRFELLSGAIGCGVALNLTDIKEHKLILDYLEQHIEHIDGIGYYLKSLEDTSLILSMDGKFSNKVNTGISHGITGALLYCCYLIDHDLFKENATALADSFYETLFNISKELGERNIPSYYPDSSPPRQNTWCYGDMGIGIGMIKYSITCKKENLFKYGEDRFLLGVKSFYNQDDRGNCLCHGRASFKTLLDTYYDLINFKPSELVDSSQDDLDYLCAHLSTKGEFITGGYGEILSLLSENNSHTNWESLLLLRNPWEKQCP